MTQHRVCEGTNVAIRDIIAPLEQGPYFSAKYQVLGGAQPGAIAFDQAAFVGAAVLGEQAGALSPLVFDESAGVPVCLEKAIKSADRRLRGSREGTGLAPGSLGVAVAVVRNNELYLATLGEAESECPS